MAGGLPSVKPPRLGRGKLVRVGGGRGNPEVFLETSEMEAAQSRAGAKKMEGI
jgi:hypothetical protein